MAVEEKGKEVEAGGPNRGDVRAGMIAGWLSGFPLGVGAFGLASIFTGPMNAYLALMCTLMGVGYLFVLRAILRELPVSPEPFCEIDAADFARAKKDPRTKALLDRADQYAESLREQGRLD